MYKAFLNFKRIYVFFLKLIKKKNMPLWKKNRKCQFSRYVLTLNVNIKLNVDSRSSFFTTMRIPILKSLPHFSVYSFSNLFHGRMKVSTNFPDKVYNAFCTTLHVNKNCIEICNFVFSILSVTHLGNHSTSFEKVPP